VKRDGIVVLATRGFLSALGTWKGLLLALALNAALAFAVVRPVAIALHETLDRSPWADVLLKSADATFYAHFARQHPDVLGDVAKAEDLVAGVSPPRRAGPTTLAKLLPKGGAMTSLLALGMLNLALAALLSGGFAGRFGASKDRRSLSAFGADCGKYGSSSLLLGALTFGLVIAAWRWLYLGIGQLYDPDDFRYEWQAILATLLRLGLFLVAASYARTLAAFARASMGLAGSANVLSALGHAIGTILRRPVKALGLEVLCGSMALVPLVFWGLFAPTWDGTDSSRYFLILSGQQLVVFLRIAARTTHLGAATAWLDRSRDTASPAPTGAAAPESSAA
jgi:hypothetical protein